MTDEQDPETPAPEPDTAPQPSDRRPRPFRRLLGRVFSVLLAVFVALLVTGLTMDLGPPLRGRAEREGSKYLQRPMRIGKLSARLIPGIFVVEDLLIEGLSPADRPFLTAKKISVNVPWWSIATRRLIVESVDMTDWTMTVETFPSGRHNFPRLRPERKEPRGPS